MCHLNIWLRVLTIRETAQSEKMSNRQDGKEWDPEGCPDFTEFPPHIHASIKEPNLDHLWDIDWMDEDDCEDFTTELQQEKKEIVFSARIPVESFTFETIINFDPNGEEKQELVKFVHSIQLFNTDPKDSSDYKSSCIPEETTKVC